MNSNSPQFDDFFKRLRRRRQIGFFLKIFRNLLLAFVAVAILLWFILQNDKVQQQISKRVTTYLSQELNTDVSMGSLDIDFFDKLVFEDFFIADQSGDTLLFSKEFKVDMNITILSILQQRYDVDNIYITDAQINLDRKPEASEHNLNFIIDYLNSFKVTKDNTKAKKPIFLDVDGIFLENLRFYDKDLNRGLELLVKIPAGEILVEEIDLNNNELRLKSTNIRTPDVLYNLFTPRPPPVTEDTTSIEGLAANEEQVASPDSTQKEFKLTLENFAINDAIFEFHNFRRYPVKTTTADVLDIGHLTISDIQIDIEDFVFTEGVINSKLKNLSLKEGSGFVVDQLYANEAVISNRKTILNDMKLITPNSELGDTIVFKYREYNDYNDFPNKVIMDARLNQAKVALKDIMVFAPKMEQNEFFKKNREERLEIDGILLGKVSNLRGKDLNIKIGKSTYFKGNFSSRNLNTKYEEVLNLKVDRLITDISTLRDLIPRFSPPANYDKLGQLNFTGRYDGFFSDFVAYGELVSDLGKAEMDMRMNLRNGRSDATYTGGLSLTNFDLGTWSGNSDFGTVTFTSEVKEGKGLTLESVDAKLGAVIDQFSFRGYSYENVTMDGQLNKEFFDGDLTIKDDNIDFSFSGKITQYDSIPQFDFKADINHLNLQALNITKQDFVISGGVDLNIADRKLSTMQGYLNAKNFKIIKDGSQEFILDSVYIASIFDPDNERIFEVNSDVVDIELLGDFNIEQVPLALQQYLDRNFPKAFERLGLQKKEPLTNPISFHYNIEIEDTKNLTTLINPELDTLRDISLTGFFSNTSDSLDVDLDIPKVQFADMTFRDISLFMEGDRGENVMDLEVYYTQIGAQNFEPLTLSGDLYRDTFDFEVVFINWTTVLDNLNLEGKFTLVEDFYQFQFSPSNLVILKDTWDLHPDNYLRFKKDFVDTKNFILSSGERKISLRNMGQKGLIARAENFDFSLIDELWIYEQMDFRGLFNLETSAKDLYNLQGLSLTIEADTFEVNGDDWGRFRLDAAGKNLKEETQVYLNITNGPQQLTGEGYYFPPTSTNFKKRNNDQFDFNFSIRKYPLHIVEYFVLNGLSNTIGDFGADVKINGTFKKPNFSGDINIGYGALTIDYLNTRYYINDQKARVNNFLFDVTGGQITDSLGNVATLYGGITHDRMREMGSDVVLKSDRFLALNTTKEHNPVYYGMGLVKGEVHFSGRFNKTDIDIDAETLPGSYLVIPVSYAEEAEEVSFIRFIDRNAKPSVKTETRNELLGVEVDMKLALTDEAQVQLIFDEKAGDIIEGTGTGNVKLFMNRSGEIKMYGNYTVTKGKYLFTYNNIFNKPFAVREGGTIRWEGDPFNAILNLDADYKGLNTSPFNFIAEYLSDQDPLKVEAKQSTKVDLVMNLTGPLLEPIINFEIQFPDLTGPLRSYAESKLKSISQNPNELNRQVFGLFVVGGFLPASDSPFQQQTDNIVINTFTELLTSQLSVLTTELLSEFVTNVDLISGIGIDFNYNVYEAEIIGDQVQSGTEVGIRPEIGILNDRLTFRGGGAVNYGQAYGDGAFLAGDIEVEYVITRDRRLKFRAYQLYDNTIAGERDRRGAGIRYRREGDSIKELLRRRTPEERDQMRLEKEQEKALREEKKRLKKKK